MVKYVIELCIAVFAVAYLMPQAFVAIASANLSGVNTAVATIFTVLLPILVVLGLALALMPSELKSKVGI